VILELRNDLNEGANSNGGAKEDAPVVSFKDWSVANNRSTFSFLKSFDLLTNHVSNRSGIGIQNITRGNNEFVFSRVATSPLEVGFIGSRDSVPSWSNSHGNGEVAFLGFQDQATLGLDVDNIADADLNPAKWVSDTYRVFSHLYAGLEEKDKNYPEHKQVQRKRSQEGCWTVDVKVEDRNQYVNYNHCSSANQSGKRSVLEIIHELSLTEEEVG